MSVLTDRYGQEMLDWVMFLTEEYRKWGAIRIDGDSMVLTDCGTTILEWLIRDVIAKAFPERALAK